jgi:hypothetical protein
MSDPSLLKEVPGALKMKRGLGELHHQYGARSLGMHFWLRILSFIGVPALSLVVAQFPEIADLVSSWIQPSLNAMK